MPKAIPRDAMYHGRRFSSETIELCVRWYITYRLSYRDLAAMMAEQGIVVSHTTIMRWVLQYVPAFEQRWARYARPVNSSWRMDETAVCVRGGKHYLYRAVDKNGKSVDHMLRADRGTDAAQAFLRKAATTSAPNWPHKINLDGNAASHRALRLLGDENPRWRSVLVRDCRYLNNIVEQDHRAIKRRCASMLGFKSYRTAAITLAGVELAHRIRKRQFSLNYIRSGAVFSLKELWGRALVQAPKVPVGIGRHIPPMHQDSARRDPSKISYGRGLHLLVTPRGGQYWRFNYRSGGKQRTLALGVYPNVSVESALAHHREARTLLAAGVDPSAHKRDLKRKKEAVLGYLEAVWPYLKAIIEPCINA